jgi:hypothetical protein
MGSEGRNEDEALRHYHKRVPEFCRLQYFNLVIGVVIDYLHLLLAGIIKKILNHWNNAYQEEKKRIFVSNQPADDIARVTQRLKVISMKYFPSEFQRRPDAFDQSSSWKCTQVRDFVLYFSVAVLGGVVQEEYLTQFEMLQECIRILCKGGKRASTEMVKKIEKIFLWFLKNCVKNYGSEFMSHNFHLLTHICEDYSRYGALDGISTFRFENALHLLINLYD